MASRRKIYDLIERFSRINSSERWGGDLNPTQRAALDYLAHANRFSRAPSHVADYLSVTRGTVSQTLKALVRKGFIRVSLPPNDKRSVSYEVKPSGLKLLEEQSSLEHAMQSVEPVSLEQLEKSLQEIMTKVLEARGGKSFGVCKTCRFHTFDENGAFCQLLELPLHENEVELRCVEYQLAH